MGGTLELGRKTGQNETSWKKRREWITLDPRGKIQINLP